MDKILWFCRSGDNSSLSRITDSVIPILRNKMDITLLSNDDSLKDIKHIKMGADCSCITYNEYIMNMKINNDNDRRVVNMKYILVQITDAIFEGEYKYLLLCNGIYEIDWFSKILTSSPRFLTNKHGDVTKLVVWSPIDYIPCYNVIQNVIKADLFITMTPVMTKKILELSPTANVKWVGHGSDIHSNIHFDRNYAIAEINKTKTELGIITKSCIYQDDIIILNANNYGPLDPMNPNTGIRKRLDITIKSFIKLLNILEPEVANKTKLWIHTHLKSFFQMIKYHDIDISNITNNLILSNNNVSNTVLTMIYKISSISLQTSFSEGWSLTNMEAAVYNSLQIVPDFLACGWHFSNGRGILIPVTEKTIKNEAGFDVIIGEVSVDDTCHALVSGIDMIISGKSKEMTKKAKEYAESYTWSNVVDKLYSVITTTTTTEK